MAAKRSKYNIPRPVETITFSDFNGIPKGVDTEFNQNEQNWRSNRMILGDSLQVMVNLAEREGLCGVDQIV